MRASTHLLLATALALGCAHRDGRTLADLHDLEPDMTEAQIGDGLDQAMLGYEKFLASAPTSALTPEAMRRLADLKIEKEYGIHGRAEASDRNDAGRLPSPEPAPTPAPGIVATPIDPGQTAPPAALGETDHDFERRATAIASLASSAATGSPPPGVPAADAGPLEAIALYDELLETYPSYPYNDWVLYQKARAFDELGRSDEAIAVIEELVARHPSSRHIDEVQFRRAEYFFTRKRYLDAEEAYAAITVRGPISEYYELALYKLGWSLYKQEMHEEALVHYVALLDHKVTSGYDFDQTEDESDERRVADTFRVISLSFSELGGAARVSTWFSDHGSRSYEDRVYRQLAEFYFEKLRYHDAAVAYETFVDLHPGHDTAPDFSMRIVEIYEVGGFPKLVLEAKKEFARRYGLGSDYWLARDPSQRPGVLADLKQNLGDLANHHHALYQEPDFADERAANFAEGLHWYRAYLSSFPGDAETPALHHRLADLLLEHEEFARAAIAYEQTAYAYAPLARSAEAGYAAIVARREHEQRTPEDERAAATRLAVSSTLWFVETFPAHEHAAVVLGAAVEDLYALHHLELALSIAHRLIDDWPEASVAVRRAAWAIAAHSSFDLEAHEDAERAYTRVLEMTPADDPARDAVFDSLAASVYKQGEAASAGGDPRAAAAHFLRVATVAPLSDIRPVAEYDAAAAFVELADWGAAAAVLRDFRASHPGHDLQKQVTRQLAHVHREQGDDALAGEEYERVADESEDDTLRSEALLLAGELYLSGGDPERALAVYGRYVDAFPTPLETALETRFEMAGLHEKAGRDEARRVQLARIVADDRTAGARRTPRVRVLAARSALALAERGFERFQAITLVQPFEPNLEKKQARMQGALAEFEALVEYEVGDVTAAATYYIAEIYLDFSRSLMDSERPAGLDARELGEYDLVLEEEAFPFEEQAISVHQKNLELLSLGVFNPWIDRSLDQLAALMPGRYAKFESSTGLLPSIDRYAFQAPAPAPLEPAASGNSGEDPVPQADEAPGEVPASIPDAAEHALDAPASEVATR